MVALSVFASDRPEKMSIATTARIVRMNAKTRTMLVRGSEGAAALNMRAMDAQAWQGVGLKLPEITLPGGISIVLPGKTGRLPQPKSPESLPDSLSEYTIVTTNDTVFQDGAASIRFDDFKNGETISVHGVLSGSTLTASRLAKWD
jgi:hypothetical protein